MWHKPCRTFHPWCPCIKTRCLYMCWSQTHKLTHWPLGNLNETFQIISVIDGWSCLRWMSLDLTDDKSKLVQVMAWCHQAPSHYMSQCWPRSLSPIGVSRPQWVNLYVLKGFEKIWRHISMISITCQNVGGASSWNLSSRKTRSSFSYIISAMAADDLATEGARASTAMVLTSFSQLHSGFRVKVYICNTVAVDVSVSMTLEHP